MASGRAATRTSLAAALALLTAVLYLPAVGYEFVDLDDSEYVYENPRVLAGVSAAGTRWALTTHPAANWHPLTWLTPQHDAALFGVEPAGHHATSILLHAVNAALLLLLLDALTGATWASAAAAALFAVHPLRVESVAWVAERKDVLSALVGLLALLAWVAWTRRGGTLRYLAATALYALGLTAKPMLVTLPFVLLLLDLWPLRRLARRADLAPRLREKAPWLALAAVSAWVTHAAQAAGGAKAAAAAYPWPDRLANAALAIVAYLRDLVWPARLAAFYPHPNSVGGQPPYPAAALAGLVLALASAWALSQWRRRPWLAVGWFAFLGMLVPVLGFVQVGSQARADRYTYLPAIGIGIAVVWSVRELVGARPRRRALAAAATLAVLAGLAVATRAQLAHWRDTGTLYRRALAVTEKNFLAWNNYGLWHLERRRDPTTALDCFRRAAEAKGDYPEAWYNAGLALNRMGEHGRAVTAYQVALRMAPASADAWTNLGSSYRVLGRRAEALDAYRRALAVDPGHPATLEGLARLGLSPAPGAPGGPAP
jgi:tetratricopeptide (TPR) repeat protein